LVSLCLGGDVQDPPRVDGFGVVQNYQNLRSSDQAARNNIWHDLRVKNTTKFPWTSTPALVISGTKPLSHGLFPCLRYHQLRRSEN
jgi:hypothetical protein